MNLVKYVSLSVFLLMFVVVSQPAVAAGSKCTYSKSVQQGGTTLDIISRPAGDCSVQIVTVSARRGGRKIAEVKADVDYLAQTVKAVDLTGDGTPELAVISRVIGGDSAEMLDVYMLDGTNIRRVRIPELDDKSGYKGGDRFQFKDRMIVRSIPVYRDGDPAGKPTGGSRSLRYEFKDGALLLSAQGEMSGGEPAAQSVPAPATEAAVDPKPSVPVVVPLVITDIRVVESGIEIAANGAIGKYKTILLDKPERIVIDIPGADSSLAGKKIAINRFGITAARVDRHKGYLRIVIDTADRTFGSYKMKSSGSSMFMEFIQ